MKVTPTLPTVRVMFAITNMMYMIGEPVKIYDDWHNLVKFIKNEKNFIPGLLKIPDNLDILSKHRKDIFRLKKK